MRPPIKIIHKYKNNQNYVGYKIYIFLGPSVDEKVKSVLGKIKNLSFEESLIALSKADFEVLNETYGDKWYYFFFNKHHLLRSKNLVKKNASTMAAIKRKLGEKWINTHLAVQDLLLHPVFVDKYADYIRNTIKNRRTVSNNQQVGGADDEEETLDNEEEDEDEELIFDAPVLVEEQSLENFDDEINLDQVNIDEDVAKTNSEIRDIVSSKNVALSNEELAFANDPFEKENDNQELYSIVSKEYIYKNFIYLDDTVYKVKTKICDSIKLPQRFENNYLLPSRVYLWSEYFSNDMIIDRIMLGSKWIKKSELWSLDVEPKNDINAYTNLTSKSLQDLNYAYKKYSNRIRRDDDEFLILHEYWDYITNYELFMIDIYTQVNNNFIIEDDKLSNFINTFVRIYFPTIVLEVHDVLAYLRSEDSVSKNLELKRMEQAHKTIRNDMIMEREVIELVENTNVKSPKMFSQPYIIQTVVHLDLKIGSFETLNLRKVFDNFILEEKYPFVQLQLSHEKPIRKLLKNSYFDSLEKTREKANYLKNWLKSNSFGITIKVMANDNNTSNRFLTITITENGRVQYKIQWREENKTALSEITSTFAYIGILLDKINLENDFQIPHPEPHHYKYVFINSMQQFSFSSKNNKINHNDLSDFCRLFFPYVSVVIEPKKRVAREKKNNASKWGTYLRFKRVSNYEDETKIGKRIVYYLKNYEIDEIMLVKVIENEFNITEKEAKKKILEVSEKYPVNKRKGKVLKRLETITPYKPPGVAVEIQGKNPESYKVKVIGSRNEYQMMEITTFIQKLLYLYQETYLEKKTTRLELLKKLERLTDIAKRRNFVRDIVEKDETEAYYAIKKMKNIDPERLGKQSQYDSSQYTRDCQNSGDVIRRPQQFVNEKEVVERGYKLNPQTNLYEKTYKDKETGEKLELVALKFESANGSIYYTCDPELNKERKFIGVLSKSSGLLPCCFKKNQLYSNNYLIKQKFLEAIGQKKVSPNVSELKSESSHMLYIKHYSNKITHERLYFLPELLDTFMNVLNNKTIKRSSKLELAPDGYYLLFGVNTTEYKFLHAISYAVGKTVNQIKNDIISSLKKNENLFISANGGEVANSFKTRKNFINFVENSEQLDFYIVKDFIYHLYSINLLIFDYVASKEDYRIVCVSNFDVDKEFMILIKDNYSYNIVVEITKKELSDKKFERKLLFNHSEKVIQNILNFYTRPCVGIINQFDVNFYKKVLGSNITKQFIDTNNRVVLILSSDGKLFPVNYGSVDPSLELGPFEEALNHAKTLDETLKDLKEYDFLIPTSLLKRDNLVEYIKFTLKDERSFIDYEVKIPIKPIKENEVKTNLNIENSILISNDVSEKDLLRFEVNKNKIYEESFQLFRLELSHFLTANTKFYEKIFKNINSKKSRDEKKLTLIELTRKIMLKCIKVQDISLDDWFKKNEAEIMKYKLTNVRIICSEKVKSLHCYRNMLTLPKEWAEEFLVRVAISFTDFDVSGKEILKVERYFVSDVVDSMNFTFRNNQLIIKGNDFNLQKIIDELYGEGVMPNLGKKKSTNLDIQEEIQEEYLLIEYEDYFSQRIISNNMSVMRGLVNGFYYQINKTKYNINTINLGHKSALQTNLVNYFKGKIISWLRTHVLLYKQPLPKEIGFGVNDTTLIAIHKSFLSDKYWLLLLWAFNMVTDLTVSVLDLNNSGLYTISNGKINMSKDSDTKGIVLRISFNSYNTFPKDIEVLYYKSDK